MSQGMTVELPFVVRRGRRRRIAGPAGRGPAEVKRRVPLVARLMALAVHFEGLLTKGALRDYAEIAALGQVSSARVTQIMNLTLLAPDLQEAILFLPEVEGSRDPFHLAQLQPITQVAEWAKQRRLWAALQASTYRSNEPEIPSAPAEIPLKQGGAGGKCPDPGQAR